MPALITAEEIFSILQKEKKTGELLQLEPDFYKKNQKQPGITKHSRKQRRELSKDAGPSSRKENSENAELHRLWKEFASPNTGRGGKVIYIRIKNIITEEEKGAGTKLKVFEETPEIITPEGKKIGPFHKNETVEVNKPEAEFMINNNIAKKVDE